MSKTKILYYPKHELIALLNRVNQSIRETIISRGERVKNVNNYNYVKNRNLFDIQDESIITKELDNKVETLLSLVKSLKLHLRSELSYVTALTLDKSTETINKDGSKDKHIIVSLCMVMGLLDLEFKTNLLAKKSLPGHVVIFVISVWGLQGMGVETQKIEYKDSVNKDQTLNIIFLDYKEFFNSLDVLMNFKIPYPEGYFSENVGLSPIFIFKELHWSNILLLFKQAGYSVHGGSITRRHKLSMSELRLSKFMDTFELNLNKEYFYLNYIDKVLTSNTYDKKIFENLKYDKEILAYDNLSREYVEYVRFNEMSYLYYHLMKIKKEYKKNHAELKEIKNILENNKDVITGYENTIEVKEYKLQQRSTSSEKHRSAVTGSIKKLKVAYKAKLDELHKLKHKYDSLLEDVYKNKEELDSISDEADSLMCLLSTIWGAVDQELDFEESRVEIESSDKKKNTEAEVKAVKLIEEQILEKEMVRFKNRKNKRQKQNFEFSFPKRDYSTTLQTTMRIEEEENQIVNSEKKKEKGVLDKDNKNLCPREKFNVGQFYADEYIFTELQEILKNSSLNVVTEIKIEKILMNKGFLMLDSKYKNIEDMNYSKISLEVRKNFLSLKNGLILLLENFKKDLKRKSLNGGKEKLSKVARNKDEGEGIKLIKTFEIVENLDNDFFLSIMLGRVLRIFSNTHVANKNNITTTVAVDLGKEVINKFISIKKGSLSFSDYLEENREFSEFWDQDIHLSSLLGMRLLDILKDSGLIQYDLVVLSKENKVNILIPSNKFNSILEKSPNLVDIPYKLPMIVKPKEYSFNSNTKKNNLGGYYLNDVDFFSPLIIKNVELKEQSHISEVNQIYDVINKLSSIGFKINTQVLNFILEYGLKYNLIVDPNAINSLEIRKSRLVSSSKKNQLNKEELKDLESYLSKKKLEMNILGIATLFKDVAEFYFPLRMDNRGRIYCLPEYLNYQSIELAKSLLLFSKGASISKSDLTSINFIKIFGANSFGGPLAKDSFKKRIQWVDDNLNQIINFVDGDLISQAESKFLFIAFCFEFNKYLTSLNDSNTYFYSNLPVQLDGTCNGYQHLSMLIGDKNLAKYLNIEESNETETPKDFYSFIAIKLKEYLYETILKIKAVGTNENSELKLKLNSFERLYNLNINRSLVKLPIMIKPYNATHFQMVNHILSNFDFVKVAEKEFNMNPDLIQCNDLNIKGYYSYKLNKEVKLSISDMHLLTSYIEKVIFAEFPKINEFSLYLKKVATICTILNINIPWVLPTGLNVNQYYVDKTAIKLKPFSYSKKTFNINVMNFNKINKIKQTRALMPNLIHSLDAASLTLLCDSFFKDLSLNNQNIFTVHDCFAVTANNVEVLYEYLKGVYISLYSNSDYLKSFDAGIISNIKLVYGKEAFDDETREINVIVKDKNIKLKYPDINVVLMGKIAAIDIQNSYYLLS